MNRRYITSFAQGLLFLNNTYYLSGCVVLMCRLLHCRAANYLKLKSIFMKKFFLFSLLLVSVCTGFSQKFINGVGVCVFSTGGSGFNPFITGGITYSPRFNVSESDNSS